MGKRKAMVSFWRQGRLWKAGKVLESRKGSGGMEDSGRQGRFWKAGRVLEGREGSRRQGRFWGAGKVLEGKDTILFVFAHPEPGTGLGPQ